MRGGNWLVGGGGVKSWKKKDGEKKEKKKKKQRKKNEVADEKERERLRGVAKGISPPQTRTMGVIPKSMESI